MHINTCRHLGTHATRVWSSVHTTRSLSCPSTAAVSISPCPTLGSWPGLGLREKEGRAVVCRSPVYTLP